MYSRGETSRPGYVEWAKVLDPDYDVDYDVDARFFCAYVCGTACFGGDTNFDSCLIALLNQWERNEEPGAWDEATAWVQATDWRNVEHFADEAQKLLVSLNRKYPRRKT